MNYGRIILLVILAPIAWRWGPGLFDWLSSVSPSFGAVLDFLIPSAAGKGGEFWVKFLAGLFIFWVIAKISGPIFGFTGAKSQQYGTTKSARRFQGLLAEGMTVGLLFGVISLVGSGYQQTPAVDKEELGNPETQRLLRKWRQPDKSTQASKEKTSQGEYEDALKRLRGKTPDEEAKKEFEGTLKRLREAPSDPEQREFEDAVKRQGGDPKNPPSFKPPQP